MKEQASFSKNTQHESKGRVPWGIGRIIFLAHAERIQKLLEAGYSHLSIYQKYEAKLGGLSYSQFSHHIRKRLIEPKLKRPAIEVEIKKAEPKQPVQCEPRQFKRGPNLPDSTRLI